MLKLVFVFLGIAIILVALYHALMHKPKTVFATFGKIVAVSAATIGVMSLIALLF